MSRSTRKEQRLLEQLENGIGTKNKLVERFELPEGVIEKVQLTLLRVDETYQRGIKGHHKQMVADWRPALAGILIVGLRPDGDLWLIDGLQRRQAMLDLKINTWPAYVLESDGVEYEAKIYDGVNNKRRALTAYETFKSQLVAGDEYALAAKRVAEEAGFFVLCPSRSGHVDNPDNLGCFRLLYGAVKTYKEDGLKRSLTIIKRAWSGQKDGVRENMISGLLVFLARFDKRVDDERLIKKMKEVSAAAAYDAAMKSIHIRKGRSSATARMYAHLYNRGLLLRNRLLFGDEI